MLSFIQKKIVPYWEQQQTKDGMSLDEIKGHKLKMSNGASMLTLLLTLMRTANLEKKTELVGLMKNELHPKEIDYFLNLCEFDLKDVASEFKRYLKFERAGELMKPLTKKDLLKDAKKRVLLHDDEKTARESEYSSFF